jgi:hypothetical protein
VIAIYGTCNVISRVKCSVLFVFIIIIVVVVVVVVVVGS